MGAHSLSFVVPIASSTALLPGFKCSSSWIRKRGEKARVHGQLARDESAKLEEEVKQKQDEAAAAEDRRIDYLQYVEAARDKLMQEEAELAEVREHVERYGAAEDDAGVPRAIADAELTGRAAAPRRWGRCDLAALRCRVRV